MRFEFEPEVELPAHPYDAAVVFLAVMAYPEPGAGEPGAAGSEFGGSLVSYMHWQARRHKGLAQFRRELNDPRYLTPQWAQFRGKMNRGLKRLARRAASYSFHGTRVINTFFAARQICAEAAARGQLEQVYDMAPNGKFGVTKPEIWARCMRSARQTAIDDIERWSKSFGLNLTNRSADDVQKAKDLVRRAVKQSSPVLHMAHAFNQACVEVGPTIGGWGSRHPALALLMNSEKWIDKAIQTAEKWRILSDHHFFPDINPDRMIHLSRANPGENAP